MADNIACIATKACSQCKEVKEISLFAVDRSKSSDYCSQCKECQSQFRKSNKEKIKNRQKKYREKNKESISAGNKKYWQANKKRIGGEYSYDKVARRRREKYREDRSTMHFILYNLIRHAKSRARKNNLPFDLTVEWLEGVIVTHCPITLQPIDWLKEQVVDGKVGPNSPSIDKVIPALGYVQSNCAIISHRANFIKNSGTVDEHRRVVQYMAAQQLRDTEF